MKAYVYILRCSDSTLYTGWTTDLDRRLREHNSPDKGAKYTRTRQPVTLAYHEVFEDEDPRAAKIKAMRREWFIKNRMSKHQKEALIGTVTK